MVEFKSMNFFFLFFSGSGGYQSFLKARRHICPLQMLEKALAGLKSVASPGVPKLLSRPPFPTPARLFGSAGQRRARRTARAEPRPPATSPIRARRFFAAAAGAGGAGPNWLSFSGSRLVTFSRAAKRRSSQKLAWGDGLERYTWRAKEPPTVCPIHARCRRRHRHQQQQQQQQPPRHFWSGTL